MFEVSLAYNRKEGVTNGLNKKNIGSCMWLELALCVSFK
jgi:hypothetical protein